MQAVLMSNTSFSFDEERSVALVASFSKVENNQIMVPLVLLEEVNSAFLLVMEEDFREPPRSLTDDWIEGALSVMNVFKKINDGLLGTFASELVPDYIPDDQG
jgi:hypothetical protein